MIVYVIHENDYDWTPIDGVFSTLEKAEEWCRENNRPYYDIQEWKLDDPSWVGVG